MLHIVEMGALVVAGLVIGGGVVMWVLSTAFVRHCRHGAFREA